MSDEDVFKDNIVESPDETLNANIESNNNNFLESAYDKAKDIAEIAFTFALSVILLFLQNQECHFSIKLPTIDDYLGTNTRDISQDLVGNETRNETISDLMGNVTRNETLRVYVDDQLENRTSDILKCDFKNFDTTSLSFCISVAIAVYGLCIAGIVLIHAARLTETGASRVEDIYMWTDQIPIIDSLIEIPIAFYFAPVNTLILWGLFMACLSGLVLIVLEAGKDTVESDQGSLLITSILILYHVYKMTGNISQYYVIYKTAATEDIRDEKLEMYMSSQNKVSLARQTSSKREMSLVSSQRQLNLARQMSDKKQMDLPRQSSAPMN